MGSDSHQGTKVPLIFISVAVLVIAAGVLVRSLNSSSPVQAPESAAVSESDPVLMSEPEPMPLPEPPSEPVEPIKFSSLAATDENGDNWRLGLAGVPPLPPEDGKKPGTPLIVKADVHSYGSNVSIGLIIQGQAGEIYEPGAAKNGRRRSPPTFKVFDESGNVLGSGSFEYG